MQIFSTINEIFLKILQTSWGHYQPQTWRVGEKKKSWNEQFPRETGMAPRLENYVVVVREPVPVSRAKRDAQ